MKTSDSEKRKEKRKAVGNRTASVTKEMKRKKRKTSATKWYYVVVAESLC